MAGEAADGFTVHPFHTPRYLEEVLLPAIEKGAQKAGRKRSEVKISVSAFIASDSQDSEFARQQIAFYASTPSYRPVMALHGWEAQAEQLSALASRGRWAEMPALIGDDMLGTFATLAPREELMTALIARYTGLADRLSVYIPFIPGERDEFWREFTEKKDDLRKTQENG